MKILVTAPQGLTFDRHFPEHILSQLRALGEVILNPFERQFTKDELRAQLQDTDILITHWGTPQITGDLLAAAPKLKLLAHGAGTVAHIASEAFYEKGVPVISANSVMAKYVAESVLAYILAALHRIPQMDSAMHEGRWTRLHGEVQSLSGSAIGLIGLGSVGRNLLDYLRPFRVKVHVYDPYLSENALDPWDYAHACSFETAMEQPIVSVHAAQTPETFHMINARALAMMPEGGLLVNTARGSLVDTQALAEELKAGRIRAVLDVFEKEGEGNAPGELARYDNILLQPHMAASAVTYQMTQAIIDDIRRLLTGEKLTLEIPLSQYRLMTQE